MTYFHDYDFANLGKPYSFTPFNAYTYGNSWSNWGSRGNYWNGYGGYRYGAETPYSRSAGQWAHARNSEVRRSGINSSLGWSRENSENHMRHSMFRLRNETAVDHIFRRF